MAVTKIINSEEKQYKPVLVDKLVLDTVPTAGSFNGVTSDGVAKAISGSGNVPTPAAGDNGKVLTADNGSYSWAEPTGVEYYAGEGITISDENAISITETIRNGAAAGATAVQPHDLASVATTGDYDDLSNKPTIPAAQVNADWEANSGVAQILNKPTLAAVATSGSYSDLSNKPNIPAAQVNADWNAESGVAAILNKPNMSNYAEKANLATVATTGSYTDLSNKPTIPAAQVQSNWAETDSTSKAYIQNKPDMTAYAQTANLATVATTGSYTDLSDKPALATVATSGSYADLSNKPSIPAAQVNADWDAASGVSQILNKPNLATVATTGSYNDLTNKPTIPSAVTVDQHFDAQSSNAQSGTAVAEAIAGTGQVPTVTSADDNKVLMASYEGGVGSFSWEPSAAATQVNADWDATSGVAKILNKPDLSVYAQSASLATVATSGNYNDLSNRPSIPAAQVNADWDAASGVAQILNKPTFATVATSGDYDDLTNKPTIPAAQVQANWNESDNTSKAYIQNKPDLTAYAQTSSLATVATTGDYDDLTNKPTIPAAQVQSNWNETSSSSKAYIQNKPDLSVYAQSANLATVATSGSYNDLSDKPSIPAAVTVDQVYSASSANAQSGVAVASAIAGKQDTINDLASIRSGAEAGATAVQPSSLATVATTGSYSDLSNKPTIPTVDQTYNSASTNAQSGVAVAQAIAAIPSASYTAGDGIDITSNEVSVNAGTGLSFKPDSITSMSLIANPSQVGPDSFGYYQLGRLTTEAVAAIKNNAAVKVTPLFTFECNNYTGSTVDFHLAIAPYNGSNAPDLATGRLISSTNIGSYFTLKSGIIYQIAANTQVTADFSTLDTTNSNLSWASIEANPSSYILAIISYDASFSSRGYARANLGSSAPTQVVSTVAVTIPSDHSLEVTNPLPASTSVDENKVLTVNSSGNAVWAAAQGTTYTAGDGIAIDGNNVVSADVDGSTIGIDSTTKKIKLLSTIPAAQVNSDWNAVSGVAKILNKPTIPTVDQNYSAASANAQSGVAVAQAIAAIPSASYTAGDGIDITANEVSVNTGTGLSFESAVTSTNLSAPAAQTGGSTNGHSLLGKLNADIVAALKAGTVTVKPLFAFSVNIANGGVHFAICQNNGYNQPNRSGNWLIASDAVSSETSGTYTMTVGDSYTADFSTLDAKSNITWSAVEASPTSYYLQLISYDTRYSLSDLSNYASINIGPSVPTEDVVTCEVADASAPKMLAVSDPIPSHNSTDANKVLTVNSSGNAVWATQATVTVDQNYNASSTNAQSGTAVASAISTIRQVPSSTYYNSGDVLTVNMAGMPSWGTPMLGDVHSIQLVSSIPSGPDSDTLYLIPEA